MLLENTTPYLGKLVFRFEKYPEYTGGKSYSVHNKTYLNLGFTKLVSRLIVKRDKETGLMVDPEKIKLIEEYTNGKIGTYRWWVVQSDDGGTPNPTVYSKKEIDGRKVIFKGELDNYFMTNWGESIGDISTAWWYYKNHMKVYNKYPHGVAMVMKNWKPGRPNYIDVSGYYGHSHRGGQTFKIGDRLFDETYIPVQEDYPEWQWAGYEQGMENSDWSYLLESESPNIVDVIPFTMRGKKTIKNWKDVVQAAINLSKYLS